MSHSASCFSTDLSSPCHHLFPNRHHLLIFLPLPPHLRIPSYFFRACPSLPVPLVPLLSCFHFISRFTSRAHFCPVLLAFTSLLLLPPPPLPLPPRLQIFAVTAPDKFGTFQDALYTVLPPSHSLRLPACVSCAFCVFAWMNVCLITLSALSVAHSPHQLFQAHTHSPHQLPCMCRASSVSWVFVCIKTLCSASGAATSQDSLCRFWHQFSPLAAKQSRHPSLSSLRICDADGCERPN